MVYGIVPVDNMMRTICLVFPLLLVFPAVSGDAHGLTTENFIHHNEMKNWNDAQTHCRQHHTDLVTINSAEENQDFVAGQGWIGLYRKDSNSEWKWSRRDEIADFTNWLDDNPKYGEDCAYKYPKTNKWESDPCNTRHTSMCYNERLVLVKEKKTWEQALRHCTALEAVNSSKPATDHQNHRCDLATVLTPDDHVYARKMAQGATTDEVWTGLRYLAGQWLWVAEGHAVQYGNIQSCQSQSFCGVLVKRDTTDIQTRDCEEEKNFLCYKWV